MAMEQIITCENLTFSYNDPQTGEATAKVLDGINFAAAKGDFIAILGHNGCGKSTLAKHFNAVLLPKSGTCKVLGIDTTDESQLIEIRRHVGMVFQNPDNQIVATVVEEDVAFALENLGVPTDEIRKRVDEALELVEMQDFAKHAPHQLSGGQKQRVAIAGIIAMRPDCIVLDEPTAMLDPRGRREVMETIRALNKYYGVTVILITHYMDEAASANRVVVMNRGKIELDGTPEFVFSHVTELKEIGLDVPQATELVFELNKSGLNLPQDIIKDTDAVDKIFALLKEKQ